MDAPSGQRVEVGRHGRYQRLALTSLHLSDVAHVQRSAAHYLNVEVPLIQDAAACFAYRRERLRQQRLERLTLVIARPEFRSLAAELLVAHRDEVVFYGVHLFGDIAELLEKFALAEAQQPIHQSHGNWLPYVVITYLHGLRRRDVPLRRWGLTPGFFHRRSAAARPPW